jgi:hypothetical protein
MKNWYSKEFVTQFATSSKILDDAFRELCAAQGGKANGAAIFNQRDAATGAVTLFFSPEAKRLAETVGAIQCNKPIPQDRFGLNIGDGQSWEIHFPAFDRARPQQSSESSPSAAATKNRRREASSRS